MSLWSALAAPFRKAATLDRLPDAFVRPEAESGVAVNWQTALDVSTVLACTRVIAEGVASMPIRYYRKSAAMTGRRERINPPIAAVLSMAPNAWQTPFEFLETLMFHVVLCGNAFAVISRVDGAVAELLPVEPGRVTVERARDLSLTYRITTEAGQSLVFPSSEVWHLRGPSWNSWMGLEATRLAREAIGLSIALERSHARLHKNGVKTSGLYAVEGSLSPQRYEQLREYLRKQFTGNDSHSPMIMDQSAKYYPQVMSGVDSQHLETRRHQIEEICRSFRLFPIMVGHAGNNAPTFASSEQFFLAHMVHGITPWAARVEQSAERALLKPTDDVDIRFHLGGLMRGAVKDRAEYNAKALGAGGSPAWATVNEIRESEDLDWKPGYDDLPVPTNVGGTPPASQTGSAA